MTKSQSVLRARNHVANVLFWERKSRVGYAMVPKWHHESWTWIGFIHGLDWVGLDWIGSKFYRKMMHWIGLGQQSYISKSGGRAGIVDN